MNLELLMHPLHPVGYAWSKLYMTGWPVVPEDHAVDVMEENWLVHVNLAATSS